jgi:hypothetical protein
MFYEIEYGQCSIDDLIWASVQDLALLKALLIRLLFCCVMLYAAYYRTVALSIGRGFSPSEKAEV